MSVIEHRLVQLPSRSLRSPKTTQHKMLCEAHCRMCGRPDHVRELTKHHLVPVHWFLNQPWLLREIRNAHANIIPLCRVCHDRVDNKNGAERAQARRELRRCLSVQELAFAIQVRGKEWIDTEYPRI